MTDIDLTAAVEAAAQAMADDWNPERDPILTAMFRDYASSSIRAALPLILAQVEATDERIVAWEAVAKHPSLKSCYDEERPLLPAVLDRLSNLAEAEWSITELAPARVKPSRGELVALLYREFGSFLAHSPHNPERFWGQPADAVLALLPGKTEQEVREQITSEALAAVDDVVLGGSGFAEATRDGVCAAIRAARGGARG